MPWITNVSYKDIELGDYPDADVLIQIVCPSMEFPLPKPPIAEIQQLGAVVDVGVTMGFEDTDAYRSPNLLVKHKLLKALGMEYDLDEPFYTVYNQERQIPTWG